MPLQKVFLLPPLKGLNLYDNPFTMSPDYAVELVNFMPPTTTFSVRPAIVRVLDIEGQIKGIYSYATGSCSSYGDNWFNTTIKYSGVSELLIKTTGTDGKTTIGKIDLATKGYSSITTVDNACYNDEHAMFKHTLFFVSGEKNSACYLYNQKFGYARFALRVGDDGHAAINNLANIVIFKDYIFFSTQDSSNLIRNTNTPSVPPADVDYKAKSENALNVFFIKAQYADVIDPLNSRFWKTFENIFSPHFCDCFSIDGVLQNGGNIIKLCSISKNGSDTIATYLAAITDEGEIVLYDGTDPKDTTGAKWQVIGKFQIPPPLSKWAFCDMEGDLIVVTKNGLVSLRRVVFGQTTNVTENLEYKMMSLFKDYMFQIPAFTQYVGLFYHQRNRLLIFNVPMALPIPFNQIVVSYLFNYNTRLIFEQPQIFGDVIIREIKQFLADYIIPNWLNYRFTIEFNGDYNHNNIVLYFYSEMTSETSCVTKVDLMITIDGVTTHLFEQPITFLCRDTVATPRPIEIVGYGKWNSSLVKTDTHGQNIFTYLFPDNSKDYRVTNFISQIGYFNDEWKTLILSNVHTLPLAISGYKNVHVTTSFNRYSNKKTISIADFFADKTKAGLSDSWSNYDQHQPVRFPYNEMADDLHTVCYLMEKAFYDLPLSQEIYGIDLTNNTTYTGTGDWTSRTMEWNDGLKFYKAYFVVHFDYSFHYLRPDWTIGPHTDNGKVNYKLTLIITFDGKTESTVAIDLGSCDVNYKWYVKDYLDVGKIRWGWSNRTKNTSVTISGVTEIPIANSAMLKYEKAHGSWNFTRSHNTKLSARIELLMSQNFPNNSTAFDDYFKYLFSYIYLGEAPTATKETVGDGTPQEIFSIQDLSILPIFNHINIACDFKSTQFVFDSHFGTWSSFEDINMIKGIEHENDFYFAVPNNIMYKPDEKDFTYTNSTLYKFDPEARGDQHGSDFFAIRCSYKTVPTFDFGMPNKKIFKRLKIFGTPSVFYQAPNLYNVFPLLVTPFSDFKEGKQSYFIHAFDDDGIAERVLKKHFRSRAFHELSTMDKEKFWKAYKEENDMITQISMPIIANAGTRFGLKIDMTMNEAYMDIYGFDVYFEPTNQIL